MSTRSWLPVLLAALPSSPAFAAGFTPLSQTRDLGVASHAVPCGEQPFNDGVAAAGFEPFDETILVEQVCGPVGATAAAGQVSSIGETLLSASATTTAETHFIDFTGLLAVSSSFYEVQVDLESPARVRVEGVLAAEATADLPPSSWVMAGVILLDGQDVLFQQELTPILNDPPVEATVEHIRLLDPGLYVFRLRADALVTDAIPVNGTFAASHDVTLRAFHPADVDLDGVVAIGDLLLVLAQWGVCPATCPADVEGDGVVGISDFLDVLAAWGAVGP